MIDDCNAGTDLERRRNGSPDNAHAPCGSQLYRRAGVRSAFAHDPRICAVGAERRQPLYQQVSGGPGPQPHSSCQSGLSGYAGEAHGADRDSHGPPQGGRATGTDRSRHRDGSRHWHRGAEHERYGSRAGPRLMSSDVVQSLRGGGDPRPATHTHSRIHLAARPSRTAAASHAFRSCHEASSGVADVLGAGREAYAAPGRRRTLSPEDLEDLARGAACLGTGGGGDPYAGRLMVRQALEAGGTLDIIDLQDVPDDALIIPTAMMGAPTVLVEKLPRADEAVKSLRALERHLGQKAFATMPIECGGINSTMPLVVGAKLGLPVVDADGMGRAFPELQMETFHVYGVSGTPMAITNEYGDTAIIISHDNHMMEWLARGVTIRMGGAAYIAEYSMDGRTAKRVSVPRTLSLGLQIGRGIRHAREQHKDPFIELIAVLRETPYQYGTLIFEGKLVDVWRETTQGFARGRAVIAGAGASEEKLEILFQNENLVARANGQLKAIVPDLICVLDSETAEPITTEALRYGQRVKVMAVSVPPIMRTPASLSVFGPQAFGLQESFRPIESLSASVAR